jgi:hypothetical protein
LHLKAIVNCHDSSRRHFMGVHWVQFTSPHRLKWFAPAAFASADPLDLSHSLLIVNCYDSNRVHFGRVDWLQFTSRIRWSDFRKMLLLLQIPWICHFRC